MKKEILIITTNFFPEKTGIGVVSTNFAKMLSEEGANVTVLCALPYYPEWRIHEDYQGKLFTSEKLENINVRRVWIYVPGKVKTITRLLHEASFALLMFVRALFIRCDLIIFISPPLSAASAAIVLAWLKRCPLWCNIQDIQPDAAIALGLLKNKLIISISKILEKMLYRFSEKILVLSEGMKKNLMLKKVPENKINILPNASKVGEYKVSFIDPRESLFRKEYGLENKFIALYSGNIGVKQNPMILAEVANILKDYSEIFIAVVGDGALKSELEEEIEKRKLSNISIYPLRSEELFGDMLASVDVLLAPQRLEVVDFVMPSKLLSYLISGVPVAASANELSDLAMVLKNNGAGLVCAPENAKAFSELILAVKNNPELGRKIAERGKILIKEEYSQTSVTKKYLRPIFLEYLQ